MELHILEHSLKVASIEKEGIEICTHGLIKLAFLASKTRVFTGAAARSWSCVNAPNMLLLGVIVRAAHSFRACPACGGL
uniref:CASTOR1 N-terminal domain-containing protein n=1 Tax=Poecilia latipinna TaxID=48699 RepID=A0A3B3UKA4_9TELE